MDSLDYEHAARAERYRRILRSSTLLYPHASDFMRPGDGAPAIHYVLSPLMAEFMRWLLLCAVQSGKQRLYFLARDGYLMKRVAEIFCQQFHLPVECRYLSCSRFVLRLPLFHTDHEWALNVICSGSGTTPEQVLARAGLTAEERQAILNHVALPYLPDQPLTETSLASFHDILGKCGPFLERMDHRSAAALPILLRYLKQEGLTDGVADAIVDSGWIGTIQDCLTRACVLAGREQPLDGYYFGLYSLPSGTDRDRYHCYYFTPEGEIRRKAHFSSSLFEAVFTAPHGMTVGYRETNGFYTPLYAPVPDPATEHFHAIAGPILAYARRLAAHTPPEAFRNPDFVSNRTVLAKLIRLFMCMPTRGEANFFGSIPFSSEASDTGSQVLAARLTPQELRAWRLTRRHAGTPARESAWYAGSAVLYGTNRLRDITGYTRYQYARHLRNTYLYRKEHKP